MKFGAWVADALRTAASEHSPETTHQSSELMAKIAQIELKIERSVSELKTQNTNLQHDVRVLQLLVPRVAG
jgi:hypothetical protein